MLSRLSDINSRLLGSTDIDDSTISEYYDVFNLCANNLKTDGVDRRILFFCLERILRYKWQAANFKPVEIDASLAGIARQLLECVSSIQFSQVLFSNFGVDIFATHHGELF